MKTQSTAIALLCSIMAVTQLTGCEMNREQSNATQQSTNVASALAGRESFFSTKPSMMNLSVNASEVSIVYTYGDYFSVSESYEYVKGTLADVKTTIQPGNLTSVDELVSYTNSTLVSDNMQPAIGGFFNWNGTPLLIPGVYELSMDQMVSLAEMLKQEVDSNPGVPPAFIIVTDPASEDAAGSQTATTETIISNGLAVTDFSDSTLTMEKYAVHIGLNEQKQLVIAQCPKDYVDKILFISDNPTVASVDSKGIVTGRKNGSATITVTVDGASGYSSVMIYVY